VKQLIHGGRLLTAGRLAGEHADLLIDGDAILAVLPPGQGITVNALRIDASNRLLIPGLINAHTHGTVNLAKALADRWSLELLLNAYPRTAGGSTLEYKHLSALIGAVEMVRKGCTASTTSSPRSLRRRSTASRRSHARTTTSACVRWSLR
jgi:5-methylthioadenosine/S-adenosylhomocysteine deaminase